MNWDAIGAIGEWAGAVAVVVTLFYLAMQVRQSNVVALAEAERDFWTTWHGVVNRVGVDLEAASLFQRGLHAFQSLSQPEKLMFHTQMCGPFNQAEIAVQLNARYRIEAMTQQTAMAPTKTGAIGNGDVNPNATPE